MHYLSYGSSELDRDRPWCSVGFTEFSQTEATIFEDDYEPLPTRKHSEEIHVLFNHELSDLSGLGIVTTPETVKARLAN